MEDRRGSLRLLLYTLGTALALLAAGPAITDSAAAKAPKPGDLTAARAALAGWQLTEAERLLKGPAKGPDAKAEHTVLQARLDLQRSRFDAVIKRLRPVIANAGAWEARVVLGRALYATGRNSEALQVLDGLADAYNADQLKTASDLTWLGVALHLTDYAKNARRAFAEALSADPGHVEARLRKADLHLERYDVQAPDKEYKQILQAHPDHVEATIGMARIDVEGDRAFGEARERLDKLLAAAPEAVPAHNLLARIELEGERPEAAIERLTKHSLRLAPNDPEALALLGAARYVADDVKRYERVRKRALKVNPRFARFYRTVADHATRVHRYKEALALYQEAAEAAGGSACMNESPDCHREYWFALAGLGASYSRVGDDDKAFKYLDDALYGDPFNVRTYNLLQHFYDRVRRPKQEFAWIDVPPLRLRVHKKEQDILERHVPPLLEESWAALTKKYRFQPEPPVHVEILPDQQTFAVRSTGLPQLSAHGICFGHVVTSRSPSEGNFNWAEVLWHELSHVFHIQLSDSRVPRWFTEGLAVFESTEARPEWEREMDGDLLTYFEAKRLRGVGDFNLSFTQAKSLTDILVAYYQAYKVAKFIDATWGFDKMRQMLVLWSKRKSTPEVVEAALGVDVETLDQRFFAWLEQDLAYLSGQFRLDTTPFEEAPDKAFEAADAATDDVKRQADAAVAAVAKGDSEAALKYAERALALDDAEPRARYIRAAVRTDKQDFAGAQADLKALVAAGRDSADIQARLARLAAKLTPDDPAAPIAALEAALKHDPKDQQVYYALIAKLEAAKRPADAFAWRKKLVAVDQMNAKLAVKLLDGAEGYGASSEEVRRWAELATHVAPFSLEVQLAVGRELRRIGDRKAAHDAARSALVIDANSAEAQALAKSLADQR